MIAALFSSATLAEQCHFWEVLAHNLTISVRAVWLDDGLSDADKVAQMNAINEFQHHVTAKIWQHRIKPDDWPAASFDAVIAGSSVRNHLESAVRSTARSVFDAGAT